MFGNQSGLRERQAIIGAAAFIAILAISQFQPRPAHAEDTFGGAIAVDELTEIRGGDDSASNS
ncbi:MAG TPA: hypothetical protein VFV87_20600, partial [Pirellulaceae bacterium]|nr:hypothetical protein [Pirellulaceae bacterium]